MSCKPERADVFLESVWEKIFGGTSSENEATSRPRSSVALTALIRFVLGIVGLTLSLFSRGSAGLSEVEPYQSEAPPHLGVLEVHPEQCNVPRPRSCHLEYSAKVCRPSGWGLVCHLPAHLVIAFLEMDPEPHAAVFHSSW